MPNYYQTRIQVGEEAIDVNGHVNNVVFVQWMQDIAFADSSRRGWDGAALEKLGSTWVIRTHFITYHRSALLGDTLIAYTWPSEVRRASALRKYKFVREADGKVIASGESDWVYVNRSDGRPRQIEEALRKDFPPLEPEEEP